jgi:hypothetical protein
MRRGALLLAGAALAATAACSAGRAARTRTPEPRPDEGPWATLRDAATRRARLYDGLDHRATATATHLSLPVREALVTRLGEWKSWTPEELERRLLFEREQAATGEEFLLSFYAADTRTNDLDAVPSTWRLAVRTRGGEELLPVQVDAVDDYDRDTRTLFPWIGPFDIVYRVRFPLPGAGALAGGDHALEIASALGMMTLDWSRPAEPVPLLLPAPQDPR